jgi:hypothetical protein
MVRPYTLYKYLEWRALWWYRIDHCKEELTDDDRHYLIRKHSGMSHARFDVSVFALRQLSCFASLLCRIGSCDPHSLLWGLDIRGG